MNYESPIQIVMGEMNVAIENEVCKAVQNIGVTVDRAELLRALRYDRDQYRKGYADRDKEIIRCRDCARSIPPCNGWDRRCELHGVVGEDDFCNYAKPKGAKDE